MKHNNPYSKYRYDNSFNVHIRTGGTNTNDIFGVELLSPLNRRMVESQIDNEIVNSPWGATWVVNYVYKAARTNHVDDPLTPDSYEGPTFFKLFKL